MELIYLYIKKYGEIFENVEFNFSSNYVVKLKNNQLLVEKNSESIKKYYGDNINNVVMFFGKNGIGKSTLLDILGMNRPDRISDMGPRRLKKEKTNYSYFMLYHLYEKYYGFEFVDRTFLEGENRISNIDISAENAKGALYKPVLGNVFSLEDKVFKYCEIFPRWFDGEEVKHKLEYAYITSDKYNNRIGNEYREYLEDYIFERRYYLDGRNYEYLYKYFVSLNDINNELLQEKNIIIENCIEVAEHMLDADKSHGDYLYAKKKELDNRLGVKRKAKITLENMHCEKQTQKDIRDEKETFLFNFYSEAIEYYFLEQFIGWYENERGEIDTSVSDISLESVEIALANLDENTKRKVMTGLNEIKSFQEEYALLLYKIQKERLSSEKIDLKSILEYTLNRVTVAAKGIMNISDKQMVLEIIDLLEQLPKSYFAGKKKISIRCEAGKLNEKIVELLKKYDYYFKIRNNEHGSNSIPKLLNIKFPNMSEGQRVFLDIIAKTITAIYTVNPGDSIVLLLDEPDRALHPELARKFLDTLLDSVNKCTDRNIQIILSSHSPFIVTDILPEYVYSLDVSNGKRKIISDKDTYATNIYYLLMDSFMLENTFGEYSYKKLQEIIQILNGKEEIETEEMERIKKVIDRVGEKTIKKKMMQLYEKRLEQLNDKKMEEKKKLLNMLSQENDVSKLSEIRKILESND